MLTYVPTFEVGDNAGPKRPTLLALRSVGLGKGYPYCAASASWVQDQAPTEVTYIRTALATDFLDDRHSVRARLIKRGKCIPAGSLVVWRKGNGIYGHVGFVLTRWCGPCGYTVEANTTLSPEGQREGWFVRRRCIEPTARFRIVGFVPYVP